MARLTHPQKRCLTIARDKNGVAAPFGHSRQTLLAMIGRGFLEREKDALGYHRITPAGRQALETDNG